MKKILLLSAFVFISIAGFSQDIISLKNGKRHEVIVTEITPTLVKYKLSTESNAKIYFVYKEDVVGIMYQDGRVETFNQSQEQVTESKSSPYENQSQDQSQYQDQSQDQSQQSNPFSGIQKKLKTPVQLTQSPFSQFHVGLVFPSGKFSAGSDIEDFYTNGKGSAAMGFTAGYKYYNPLSTENLSWVFGIEVFYNGLNSITKDAMDDPHADVTYPMYFNFPATIGLNYATPLQENIKLYGEAAIGGNCSIVTKIGYSYDSSYNSNDDKYSYDATFNPTIGFAYGLEAGLFINGKYTIGLRYNNLGSYKYKIKDEDDYINKKLSITNTSLSVGILF